jgi:hypothetical protein
MKNKVNKKRGVKFLQGRAREGRGKSLHLLKATARPRSGQKRTGKKEGGWGKEFLPARRFWAAGGCTVAEGNRTIQNSASGFCSK